MRTSDHENPEPDEATAAESLMVVKRALDRGETMLAFQPIIDARDPGRPAFYEGLIRVCDPDGRVIPARNFIGAVEATEVGRLLDCAALEMGLAALVTEPALRLSINMSARTVGHARWREVLEAGLAHDPTVAERLILEITESSAMLRPGRVAAFMQELRRKGIAFALDDFGAGYTAFRQLRAFNFDILKIDGEFIRDIAGDRDNQVLTGAFVTVARHFDICTVAECVETPAEEAFLAGAGIDCLQGFHCGAPSTAPPWMPAQIALGA